MRKTVVDNNDFISKSYKQFERTINRSINLITIHNKLLKMFSKIPNNAVDVSDMIRASIVLSVAAMDSYFTSIISEILIPFLKKRRKPSKEMVEFLSNAGLNTEYALELLSMERPWRRIRTLIEGHLERYTAQKKDTIDKLFIPFGEKKFTQSVSSYTNKKKLLDNVKLVIERRHDIVHNGDVDSRGNLRKIYATRVKKRIMNIVAFVKCSEEYIKNNIIK